MEELLKLLSDGRSRTVQMLAAELCTSADDVLRKIDFLERTGVIRRVATSYPKGETLLTAGRTNSAPTPACPAGSCTSCSGCSHGGAGGAKACTACMPEGGFKNMGIMWEVVK
ncbi:MAG: Lrp/AsnC family transcriptional regulator [Spirochaetaceae bacterium]|nr:Lrp/AsnC family transcriptional regulator [Spirochaetaceae bacterium]MBP5328647.1 Lrp/AsnC family transcriptional regulator [Spirochaetaceae bacterium]